MSIPTKVLAIVVLLILIIGGAYMFTMPYWSDVQETKAVLDASRAKQEDLKREQQQLETFLAEYNSKKDLTLKTNLALPVKSVAVENVLFHLDEMAKNSGMSLSYLSLIDRNDPNKKSQVNGIEEQLVSMTASGTYPAFKNFLLLLEGNQRTIDIRDVNFSVSNISDIVEYKILFVTYYQN